MNKTPKPEVCDSCFTSGNLIFNDTKQEWLCTECDGLIKQDARDFDYMNGKESKDIYEW